MWVACQGGTWRQAARHQADEGMLDLQGYWLRDMHFRECRVPFSFLVRHEEFLKSVLTGQGEKTDI